MCKMIYLVDAFYAVANEIGIVGSNEYFDVQQMWIVHFKAVYLLKIR